MNWSGFVLGLSLALALLGGGVTAFARQPRAAVGGLAAAMLGVAGACLTMGNEYLAIVIGGLGGVVIPSIMTLALHAGSTPESDLRLRGRSLMWVWVILGVVLLTARIMLGAAWPPAGGSLQDGIEWLGSRLLTDHIATIVLACGLLSAAACAAVALMRGRTARR